MWATGAYGYLSDYVLWWLVFVSILFNAWCFFRFHVLASRPRTRLIVGNLLVGLCLLAAACMVSETYLRFVSIETDAFGTSMTSLRWKAAYEKVNSLFCRDAEWSEHKPAGVRRIAFVGDSFVYGWGINDPGDRFSELLQERFNQRDPGQVEAMNVAWWNWDTPKELAAIHDVVLGYDVDQVVLCYVPNDIDTLLPEGSPGNIGKAPRSVYFNTESSFLFDFIYHRIYVRRLPMVSNYCDAIHDAYFDEQVWSRQKQRLTDVIDFCQQHDVKLRVALLPFVETWGERYDGRKIHARVAEVFTQRGIETVDLLPVTLTRDPATLVVNSHDPHPNELANRLFADEIWSAFYSRPLP